MKSIELVNTGHLPDTGLYHHAAVSTGGRLVHLAGQVSWGPDGEVVAPGDLAGQVEQAYRNVAHVLAAVGGTLHDLVDVTMYVVDWRPERIGDVVEGMTRAAEALGGTSVPPATLIGVASLDVPEHLVEVKAVAVVDA